MMMKCFRHQKVARGFGPQNFVETKTSSLWRFGNKILKPFLTKLNSSAKAALNRALPLFFNIFLCLFDWDPRVAIFKDFAIKCKVTRRALHRHRVAAATLPFVSDHPRSVFQRITHALSVSLAAAPLAFNHRRHPLGNFPLSLIFVCLQLYRDLCFVFYELIMVPFSMIWNFLSI